MQFLIISSYKAAGTPPQAELISFWQPKIRGFLSHEKQLFLCKQWHVKGFYPWLSSVCSGTCLVSEQSSLWVWSSVVLTQGELSPLVGSHFAAWLSHLKPTELLACTPTKNHSFSFSHFGAFHPLSPTHSAVFIHLSPLAWSHPIHLIVIIAMPYSCGPLTGIFFRPVAFSQPQFLGKRAIPMTQPCTAHTQTYGLRTRYTGECALQVLSLLMHTLPAALSGSCSSASCQTSVIQDLNFCNGALPDGKLIIITLYFRPKQK